MADLFKSKFKLFNKRTRLTPFSLAVSEVATTPQDVRFGWAGQEEAKRAYGKLYDQVDNFFIKAQSVPTNGKRVVFWDYTLKLFGSHIPTFTQLIGDCVSQGAANIVQYLEVTEIMRLKQPERYRPIFQPYIYGISRVQIGKKQLGNSDGSLGIWAAKGVKEYGVIAADEKGVPSYSADVAKSWGRSGPPTNFITEGKKHLIQTVAKVNSYDMVRDAIVNGYGVTVASNRGFKMQGVANRGKLWGVPSGQWLHQMALIGADDDRARPGCYCLNSWGPNAHGRPADDAPAGGFWVDAEVIDSMVRQDDSWAFSQFNGFPEQNLDFMLI
jgi:hypothetical protein